MDQILEAWFDEIYDSIKGLDFRIEELPEDHDFDYLLESEDEGFIVYLCLGQNGLVFTCIEVCDFDYDKNHEKICVANSNSEITRVSSPDFNSLSYSFYYPHYADPGELFEDTLMNFFREMKKLSEWIGDPESDLQ